MMWVKCSVTQCYQLSHQQQCKPVSWQREKHDHFNWADWTDSNPTTVGLRAPTSKTSFNNHTWPSNQDSAEGETWFKWLGGLSRQWSYFCRAEGVSLENHPHKPYPTSYQACGDLRMIGLYHSLGQPFSDQLTQHHIWWEMWFGLVFARHLFSVGLGRTKLPS